MKYLEAKAKAQQSGEPSDETKRDHRPVDDKMLRGGIDDKATLVREDRAALRDEIPPALPEEESSVNATPAAISLAEELGADLSKVTGTGADGRVTVADVRAAHGSSDA